MQERPIVLAMTGASGAPYAARLLQLLLAAGREVHWVVSQSGAAVIHQELGVELEQTSTAGKSENLRRLLEGYERLLRHCGVEVVATQATSQALAAADSGLLKQHRINDYFTPIASGSHLTAGMVICPCSGATLSSVARSASDNLITRAAEVHLKERRKLIVVPRETPLSGFQLENMHRLSQAGVVVLPAAPGWYHGVQSIADLIDFVVVRILDQLGIDNQFMHRWASESEEEELPSLGEWPDV